MHTERRANGGRATKHHMLVSETGVQINELLRENHKILVASLPLTTM